MSEDMVYVEDKGGKTIRFRRVNGMDYPVFDRAALENSYKMEARPEDILLLTYPKAGTHWTFEIVRFLLAGTIDLPLEEKDSYMIDAASPDIIKGLPSDIPRNINSHFHAKDLSPDFLRKKCKMIYVTRDPRDIAVSYFHHHKKLYPYYEYEGEWKDYFPILMEGKLDYGSWFEYTKGWEQCIKDHPDNPFLVLSYEDMKRDPLSNIKKIDNFIGTNRDEEFLKEVVVKTDFQSMAKVRQAEHQKTDLVMYRKGISGDWKNKFTVAQSEMFNEIFEKEMKGTEAYKLYSHTVQKQTDANKNT